MDIIFGIYLENTIAIATPPFNAVTLWHSHFSGYKLNINVHFIACTWVKAIVISQITCKNVGPLISAQKFISADHFRQSKC